MSKWAIIALSLVFVVSTIVALFGLGKSLNAFFKGVVFDLYPCTYRFKLAPEPIRVTGSTASETVEDTCEPDKKRPLEEIIDGMAMFLPSAPLAWFAFKWAKKDEKTI